MVSTTASAQAPNTMAELAARINQERVSRGLTPYAVNGELTTAAQAHANDMALSGKLSHTGSDGSDVFARVARTRYGKYSWGYRLGENWAWYHDIATAMQMWMNSAPHRENILHPLYREMGIGIAPAPMGGSIYVLVFGAQPNVLPIFVNNGATSASSASVTLTLSDEQVVVSGDGPSVIGHPTQVQISNDTSFENDKWVAYAAQLPWTLASGNGTQTVYVKYRDANGRTATANDSIVVGTAEASRGAASSASLTPTRAPTKSPTRKPTATRTRTPRPSATRTLTPNPTATNLPGDSSEDSNLPLETATMIVSPVPTATPNELDILTETPAPVETETPGIQIAYFSTIAPPPATVTPKSPTGQASSDGILLALGAAGAAVALGAMTFIRFIKTRL